jgi:hypothetical protein
VVIAEILISLTKRFFALLKNMILQIAIPVIHTDIIAYDNLTVPE